MATVYGVNYTLAYRTVPPDHVHASKWGGRVVRFNEIYEAAALESGSTIYAFRPPKGARWTGMGKIWSDNLANNTTLAVGITGATTKFGAATNHGGGSAVKTELGLAAAIDAVDYEFDGATDVIITTGTGAGTGTISLEMWFAIA